LPARAEDFQKFEAAEHLSDFHKVFGGLISPGFTPRPVSGVSICGEYDLQPVNKAFAPDRWLPATATTHGFSYRFHRR
jgi:hypothetical protein